MKRHVCQIFVMFAKKSCPKPKHTNFPFLLHSSWHFLITPYKVQICIIIGDPSLWMEIRRPLPFHCRLLWKSTLKLPSTQNSRIQASHSERKDEIFERIMIALSGPLCIIYLYLMHVEFDMGSFEHFEMTTDVWTWSEVGKKWKEFDF